MYVYMHINDLGPFRTQNPPNIEQILSTKIVHTSGAFFEKISKHLEKYF